MKLIEHHAVDVEAVLGISLGRQDLVETVGGSIHHPLLGCEDFHPLIECRTHPHHIGGNLKDNACLLTICRTSIDFSSFLAVSATKKESDCCGKLRLALFLRNFNVGCVELTVAVFLDDAEKVTDDSLLPINEVEGFTCPCPLGMAETFDEAHRIICGIGIVARILRHEFCRSVIGQFPQANHLPSKRSRHKRLPKSICTRNSPEGLRSVGFGFQLYIFIMMA